MGYSVHHIMWEMSLPQILLLSEASKIVYNDESSVYNINDMDDNEIEKFLQNNKY